MDNNYLYINSYALIWIILLVIYLIKNRIWGIGGIILLVYSISAISSNFFYTNGVGFERVRFSFPPFIYLFICSFICILPFLKYSKQLSNLKIQLSDYNQIVYLFLLFCAPIVMEGFLEISIIAYKTNSSKLINIYEAEADIIGTQLSFIGRKTLAIIRWFQYIWPILFFYCLAKRNKYTKLCIVPLLAFLAGLFEGYAGASRVAIIRSIFYFIIIYVFFKSSLSRTTRKKINVLLISSIGFITLLLALITISRFNAITSDIDITTWISLYTGEGELRFAQHLWDLSQTSNGDTSFSLFKKIIGLDTFTDLEDRRNYYEMKLHIPTTIFYTYIGDWYFDLGKTGTVIFCCFLSLIQELTIKRIIKNKYIGLGSLLFLGLMANIFIFGIMYYTFKVYILQVLLIPTIIWTIIYTFANKKYKTKIK